MLTNAGKKAYEQAQAYGLGAFYDKFTGNILLPALTPEIRANVLRFLEANNDWALICEDGSFIVAQVSELF